jgi:hypothetical protein
VIEFRKINDADPALAHSPMVRAIESTFNYISENGAIGLTPSKAFKRTFVHWAAAAFAWPGYSETELFSINKVLNEIDFPPLMDIHDLLITLKIGRHYKNSFRLTKAGQHLRECPGRLFGIVTPFYLFEVDHMRFSRIPERPLGNWNVFLNVLNVEAEDGITGRDIRRTLYGDPSPGDRFDYALSASTCRFCARCAGQDFCRSNALLGLGLKIACSPRHRSGMRRSASTQTEM